jgi:hypothetical protein
LALNLATLLTRGDEVMERGMRLLRCVIPQL